MRTVRPHRAVGVRDGKRGPAKPQKPPQLVPTEQGRGRVKAPAPSPALDVDGAMPRPKVPAPAPAAGLRYRVVYGPPKAGVTTLLTILQRASRTPLYIVADVAAALALDPTQDGVVVVTPWPTTVQEASTVPALGFGAAAEAVLIDVDDGQLASRGATRESLAEWRHRNAEVEARLDYLGVRRLRVLNTDLESAAADLARKLSLHD